MKLSIVTGTLNRLPYLQKCIESIGPSCGGLDFEVIVVDGGSRDGTLEWLRSQRDIITIEQGAAYGAVWAYNAGFAAAEGDYVVALNDDCTLIGDTLALAANYLDTHPRCGQLAIPWAERSHPQDKSLPMVQYVRIGKQGLLVVYANFSVTRRWLGDKVGWWSNYLEHYGGDCELSFMVYSAGYTVDELRGGLIEHYRVQDKTRRTCYFNQAFATRWYMRDVSSIVNLFRAEGRPIDTRDGQGGESKPVEIRGRVTA